MPYTTTLCLRQKRSITIENSIILFKSLVCVLLVPSLRACKQQEQKCSHQQARLQLHQLQEQHFQGLARTMSCMHDPNRVACTTQTELHAPPEQSCMHHLNRVACIIWTTMPLPAQAQLYICTHIHIWTPTVLSKIPNLSKSSQTLAHGLMKTRFQLRKYFH